MLSCGHALAFIILSTAALAVVAASEIFNQRNDHDTITRNICIIGGGASGTYAAVRLGDMNQSVIVIERKDRLGGNTQTFTDPITGTKADIGVEFWHNTTVVKNFFSRFDVPLAPFLFSTQGTVEYIDFTTGARLNNGYPGNQGNVTAALQAYAAQLTKYPFLDDGFNLPNPVPNDLLIPFSDFVAKYNLSAAMTVLMDFAEGLGNLAKCPTLYVMKLLGLSALDGIANGFLTTAHHDNSEIYRNVQSTLLASNSLLLKSHVVSTDRRDESGLVRLTVSTPEGLKTIEAEKILYAIPPTLENLHNFDIDSEERSVFEQFNATGYYTGLIRNGPDIANITLLDRGLNTPFHFPTLPTIYSFHASIIPGLQHVFYGSDTILPVDQVMGDINSTIHRIVPNASATAPLEFAVFSGHTPFLSTVPSRAIEMGFYEHFNNLQGYRHMYYTGAILQTQDSSLIWQSVETLLPQVATGSHMTRAA